MKAEELIKEIRESVQKLWDAHQLFINSNGTKGMRCFNPESLEKKLARTDKEILSLAEKRGIFIEDKEEYLSKI